MITVIIVSSMASDKPFLSFVIEPGLLKRIDDYRFKHRFESRAAAIKWLLDWALSQRPAPAPKSGADE
jgi:hypothetical protein